MKVFKFAGYLVLGAWLTLSILVACGKKDDNSATATTTDETSSLLIPSVSISCGDGVQCLK